MNTPTDNRIGRERLNVPIPAALHRRLKIAAANVGVPLSALAVIAIDAELRRLDRQRPRAKQ